jgi:hypothetical protein
MDDNVPQENPPPDFNKIDLSQLQGFSFGTQWTQDKSGAGDKQGGGGSRPRRDDGPSADRRDRRAFRRPEGAPGDAPPQNRAPEPGGGGAGAGGPRREYSGGGGDRRPAMGQGGGQRDFRGGGDRGGPRGERTGPGGFSGGRPETRMPYDSPYFSVTFYPEDTSFNALVKTVRASCRTIELFEIARTVLGKSERFTVLLTRRDPNAPRPAVPSRQGSGNPEAAGAEGAPARPEANAEPIYLSVPDNLPFESEEAALSHVLSIHSAQFFDTAEVEVEPPKGNYQVINRDSVTGELLGPPNYHRYAQIVQLHYTAKNIRIPFEAYKARIESVRDPEAINQWLEKMKKVTRFTSKLPVAEGSTAPTFDAWEDARAFLLSTAKDRLVRSAAHARFHGREVETLPPGEIRRAVEGTLERQRRFPLDTANALRGRLRREHFTIFKKGAKGVSYVCAVKRKFRVPGQSFAESIGSVISFIESHPMVKAGELPRRFLGLGAEPPAGAEAGAALAGVLTIEQREKVGRLQGDLLWLVREGYVTEFIDGSLYAPPPMVESRKKEVERDEHDPENFPERPAAEAAPAADESASADSAPAASPPSELAAGQSAPTGLAAPQDAPDHLAAPPGVSDHLASPEGAPADSVAAEPEAAAAEPEPAPAPAPVSESPAPIAEVMANAPESPPAS